MLFGSSISKVIMTLNHNKWLYVTISPIIVLIQSSKYSIPPRKFYSPAKIYDKPKDPLLKVHIVHFSIAKSVFSKGGIYNRVVSGNNK